MTKVVVKNGKVDDALRTIKMKVIKNGVLKEIREKEHYSKPGEKRRNAKRETMKKYRSSGRR